MGAVHSGLLLMLKYRKLILLAYRLEQAHLKRRAITNAPKYEIPEEPRQSVALVHRHGETQFHVTFKLKHDDSTGLHMNRTFNFNRTVDEPVSKFLQRVTANLQSLTDKKTRRKKRKAEAEGQTAEDIQVSVALVEDGSTVIADDVPCNPDLFLRKLALRINGCDLEVRVNPPKILSVNLPKHIMPGFPIRPNAKFEFANQILTDWFISERDQWHFLHSSEEHTPSEEDVGRELKVSCAPFRSDEGEFTVLESGNRIESAPVKVVEGPGKCPYHKRHEFTRARASKGCIRVVTYNILADLYADSDFTRTVLHPYCPPWALDIDYRKQLILQEIEGYNGDIICLQEVDAKLYESDYLPVLSQHGFSGVFDKKAGGKVNEGMATFFRDDSFELISSECILLADAVQTDCIFADLWSTLQKNEALATRVTTRSTALSITALREKSGKVLIVGVTHLYFHPDADHIRLLQAGMCLKLMERVYKERSAMEELPVSMIMCGDFNSCPEFGVYKLMTEGFVGQDSSDWRSNEEEAVTGVELSHAFNLASAAGTPEYTNYTEEFSGCLDYIFYQKDRMDVAKVVPFPSIEELKQHTALPSVAFPSDHIAVIADLRWH